MMEIKAPNLDQTDIDDLRKIFGHGPTASDKGRVLFDGGTKVIAARGFSDLARKKKKPIELKAYSPGEHVTMRDGTTYLVDNNGAWRRLFKKQ